MHLCTIPNQTYAILNIKIDKILSIRGNEIIGKVGMVFDGLLVKKHLRKCKFFCCCKFVNFKFYLWTSLKKKLDRNYSRVDHSFFLSRSGRPLNGYHLFFLATAMLRPIIIFCRGQVDQTRTIPNVH